MERAEVDEQAERVVEWIDELEYGLESAMERLVSVSNGSRDDCCARLADFVISMLEKPLREARQMSISVRDIAARTGKS